MDAYAGFRETFGGAMRRLLLSEGKVEVGRQILVVVAFGGKAALNKYPEGLKLVSCMAPGV